MALSVIMLVNGGLFAGFSAVVGALLALANLVALRTIVLNIVSGDIHMKLPLLALIFIKMGVLLVLVYWLIAHHWVAPVAFTVGLSSLVVGMITGSLLLNRSSSS
jgi:hypothetical protein